jgi:tetratricopeptide (TPR) repeat protein
VDAILEGSVQRSGGRIRVTAELIHAVDDHHIWAQSYERDQRDIFEVQNEVTSAIAESIRLKIAPATKEKLAAARPVAPQAHDDYLRGKFYWSKRTVPDFHSAVDYFQRAITREPRYAAAYAGIANTYALVGGYSLTAQGPFIDKARAAANRALEIDPNLADAHVALAVIAQNYDWDWRKAEAEYKRAIELDPNHATAHHWYAEFLSFHGRFEEAFAEIARAEQLDPLSLIIQTDRGAILLYARQYKRAIEQFKSVIAKDAMFPRSHLIQFAYVESGQFDEALRDAEMVRKADDSVSARASVAYVLARKGETRKARALLRDIERRDDPQTDPQAILIIQLGLKDWEGAFDTFERAYDTHSNAMSTLKVNPVYDPLRNDPRFADLMKRVGFTD